MHYVGGISEKGGIVEKSDITKNKININIILILIGTIFYFFANFQRIAIPGAIFDILQSELSITPQQVTNFGVIFMYVYACTQLINGVLVDRYGGYRILLCGGAIFAIGTLLFPLSSNLFLMYISRAFLGMGGSMFYLSLLKVLKENFSDKNFGMAISVMLCIGYAGAITANAPFVMLIKYMSWQKILVHIGYIIIIGLLIFLLLCLKNGLPAVNKKSKLKLLPFRLVLHKKHNRNLFSFACCNFGIVYVIQAIIGKKFLEDFCLYSAHKAALILSVMAIIAAIFNIVNAYVCRLCHNHRVLYLKYASVITFSCLLLICLLIFLDVKTFIISVLLCILAANASLSSLLVPVLHLTNRKPVSSTAVSIMNFCFFMMVGIIGTLTGFVLKLHKPIITDGVLMYSNTVYLTIFGIFLLFSIFEVYKAMKLSNKY